MASILGPNPCREAKAEESLRFVMNPIFWRASVYLAYNVNCDWLF